MIVPQKLVSFIIIFYGAWLTWAPACAQAAQKPPKETFSDWIAAPNSQSLCQGHYANEDEDPSNALATDFNVPFQITANETAFSLDGESRLMGEVQLIHGSRTLLADELIIAAPKEKQQWDSLFAVGHIAYSAPGLRVWAESAQYHHREQYFNAESAYYRWYPRHARGYAQHIELSEEVIHLRNANYTTCAPGQDTWLLRAQEISLYPKKGRATARHIRLDLNHIPIFYFPYINYPIDKQRHSGFLFPSYGSTSNSGYEFTVPYYWNIAPNYDLNFAGRWLAERGLEGQTTARYLFPNSQGTLQWNFLPNDRKYGQFQRQNLDSPPTGLSFLDPRLIALEGNNNRSAVSYRHASEWDRRWQFNVIFNYVSDDNYFVDLENDINSASIIQLPQQANLTYYGDYWTHNFNIEEYQVLQPFSKPINEEIYKRQPQWVFQAVYPDLWRNLSFNLNGEIVNFRHLPELITQQAVTTGQRLHLRPSLSLPLKESWGFFTPRVQVDWLQYNLDLDQISAQESLPTDPSRFIPLYDLDTGLRFERELHYKKYDLVQTLEPRIYYLYVPFRDQHLYPDFDSGVINFSYAQLFRDNRFSGRDRVGDTHQVSLSLMSRFLPTAGGQEWIRASVGEILYFKDQRVSLCEELGQGTTCPSFDEAGATPSHSDLIGQVVLKAHPDWTAGLFWQWDSEYKNTEQAGMTMQYFPDKHKIINLNYYWLRHDLAQLNPITGAVGSLHEADFSGLWPLNLHWELLAVWRYNLQQRQTVEVLAGIEYNGCCVALQLVGSRYRQSNNYFYPQAYATGVFAQVVFKGLSAMGLNNPDGRLKQKIPGYVPLSSRQKWLLSPNRSLLPPEEILPY